MKKNYILLTMALMSTFCGSLSAQNVGIGTKVPDNSAVLDISSSDKGLLIPRLSIEERNKISNPADGLLIYQTNENTGFYYFENDSWNELSPTEAKAVAGTDGDWTVVGNGGLNHNTNFIGTTTNVPLVFKVNGQRNIFLDINDGTATPYAHSGTGSMFFGLGSGSVNTGKFNTGIGVNTLSSNTTGFYNTAIGFQSLNKNTTGKLNVAIGNYALLNNISGNNNYAIGNNSLENIASGDHNVAIGTQALAGKTSGASNVAIGRGAGQSNLSGSNNIFIGKFAGSAETGSDKLYISNTATTTPLIYGDFSAKFVSIGDVDPAKRASANTSGGYNLLVKGGILTEKVKVALASSADWADYVFEPSYELMSLEDVESFTKLNKHLPNVPSADEMALNGLDVNQTSKMFMEKIEELTLYMIDLNKQVKELKEENLKLKSRLK